MDIRKTDSKGRLSLGVQDKHFVVFGPNDGNYQLREVPPVEEIPEGYEYAEVSDAKDVVMDIVQDCIEHWLWYGGVEYPDDDQNHLGNDAISVADKIVEELMKRGAVIPEDFGK